MPASEWEGFADYGRPQLLIPARRLGAGVLHDREFNPFIGGGQGRGEARPNIGTMPETVRAAAPGGRRSGIVGPYEARCDLRHRFVKNAERDQASTGSQCGARLLDPPGGTYLLEKAEGALDQRPVLLHVVAAAEAAIGQQALRQFGA